MTRRLLALRLAAVGLLLAAGQGAALTPGHARALKIFILEDGLYEIGPAELAAGGPAWAAADPGRIRLAHNGREIPAWLAERAGGARLRFYAQASASPYTRENVYWLELGTPGAPARPAVLPERLQPGASPADSYAAAIHLEHDLVYQPLAREGDHWFWLALSGPAAQSLTLQASGVLPGPARLGLAVWVRAGTLRLSVSLNGHDLGTSSSGPGRQSFDFAIPPGLLLNGPNEIRLAPQADSAQAFLDHLTVSHTRRLIASGDRLAFDGPGGPVVLDGFSGPVSVVDITDPQRPALAASAGVGTIAFWAEAGHRYLASGPGGWQRPSRIAPAVAGPDLRAPGLGAHYLAIGPPDLLAALQPLLAHRAAQGLRVMAVPSAAVFDQFAFGLETPDALRAFLRHAAAHYAPAPEFVLLVGDAATGPRSQLPTYLLDTLHGGETASDVEIARLDGDPWPDVALARLPASTPAQAASYASKALAYESGPPGPAFAARVLAVADPSDPIFAAEAERLLSHFSRAYDTRLLTGPDGARQAFGAGSLWLFYLGHGAVGQWGQAGLMRADDIAALDNAGRLPVVVQLTCLTGYFIHPRAVSMAEALVLQPEGGAIAVIAPTSLTVPGDQSALWRALAAAWLADPNAPLGRVFLQAQRALPAETPGQRDVLATFLLFGDPALRLPAEASDQ